MENLITTIWKVTIQWNLAQNRNAEVPLIERTFDNFDDAYQFYCEEVENRNLTEFAEYSTAQMDLKAHCDDCEWKIELQEIESI